MTSNPMFQETFKGAIGLNNYGVALLEKHCYEQALSTLQESVHTMKSLFSSVDGFNFEVLRGFAHDAAVRLSNPHVSRHPSPGIHIRTLAGDFNHHGVSSNDCLPLFLVGNCSQSSALDTVIYPMRIDDTDNNCHSNEGIDMNVAIIFYNYALANWCFSSVAETPYSTQELQEKLLMTTHHQFAVKLLEISHNLLENVYSRCRDEYLLRTSASINATVTACIVRFLVSEPASCPYGEGNLPGICSRLLRRVLELESVTVTLDGIFYYWKGANKLAAAA